MQIDQRTIKNILVLRNDRFGEFLLNLPALRALKETFTSAKLIIVVDPYVRELANALPFIDEVIEWGREKHSLSVKLKLIGCLRKKNIDMAIMLNPSREFNIFTYLAGIPLRVGYDRKWGFLLTHKIKDRKYLGEKHEIEYNLDLVHLIGAQTEDAPLSLKIDQTIIDRLCDDFSINIPTDSVALHPWTSDPVKQWPVENFSQLASRLSKELNLKILIIGGKEESTKAKEFFSNLGSNVFNITAETTLRQLAGVLKKVRLLVSGDSGPVHLASCLGTPVIALFRNDLPGKSPKRWGPVSGKSIVIEKNNLSQISVSEVFEKTKEILQR